MSSAPIQVSVEIDSKNADIKAALRRQVEFYFSAENLSRDTYLRGLMTDDQIVPIANLCTFPKIVSLCSDSELLKKLLVESFTDGGSVSNVPPATSNCVLTEDQLGIKPAPKAKAERNTIILREIPSSTDPQALKAAFNIPNGKTVTSIHCDIGDTWFISMESEADAVATVKDIMAQKIMFEGKPLKARLKSAVSPRSGPAVPSPRGQPNLQGYPVVQMAPMYNGQPYAGSQYYSPRGTYGNPPRGAPGGYQLGYMQQGGYPVAMVAQPVNRQQMMYDPNMGGKGGVKHMKNGQSGSPSYRNINQTNGYAANNAYQNNPQNVKFGGGSNVSPSPSPSNQTSTNKKKKNKNQKAASNDTVANSSGMVDGVDKAVMEKNGMPLSSNGQLDTSVDLKSIEGGNSSKSSNDNTDNTNCRGNELIMQLSDNMLRNDSQESASNAPSLAPPNPPAMNGEKDFEQNPKQGREESQVNRDGKNGTNNSGGGANGKKGKKEKSNDRKPNSKKAVKAPAFSNNDFPTLGGMGGEGSNISNNNNGAQSVENNANGGAAPVASGVWGKPMNSTVQSNGSKSSAPAASVAAPTKPEEAAKHVNKEASPNPTNGGKVTSPVDQSNTSTDAPMKKVAAGAVESANNMKTSKVPETGETAVSFGTVSTKSQESKSASNPQSKSSSTDNADAGHKVDAPPLKQDKPPQAPPQAPPQEVKDAGPVVWGSKSFKDVVQRK